MYTTSLGTFPLPRGLTVSFVARIQAGAWGWEEQQAGGLCLLVQRQQPHERRAEKSSKWVGYVFFCSDNKLMSAGLHDRSQPQQRSGNELQALEQCPVSALLFGFL
jgi:hypothetical protein